MDVSDLRKAAEMALEALEWSWGGEPLGTKEFEAITALRQALAQPETLAQDMFSLVEKSKHNFQRNFGKNGYADWIYTDLKELIAETYHTAPISKQEQGCGECGVKASDGYALYCVKCVEPMFKKEWVSLTDDFIEDEWERVTGHSIFGGDKSEGRAMYLSADEVMEFAKAIEANLKEKNHG